MAQTVAELAVYTAPFPQSVHLVNSHALQLVRVLLEGVDQFDWLTVRVGHDEVCAWFDEFQQCLGWYRIGENGGRGRHLGPLLSPGAVFSGRRVERRQSVSWSGYLRVSRAALM